MKIITWLIIITTLILLVSCSKDLLFQINRDNLIGTWFVNGAQFATDKCKGEIYDPNCLFYTFKSDGTFTTSKSIKINDITKEKKATQICITGKWEIQSEGDYNTKFTFDGKDVYWNINLSALHKDRMNIFEKDCKFLDIVFVKEE